MENLQKLLTTSPSVELVGKLFRQYYCFFEDLLEETRWSLESLSSQRIQTCLNFYQELDERKKQQKNVDLWTWNRNEMASAVATLDSQSPNNWDEQIQAFLRMAYGNSQQKVSDRFMEWLLNASKEIWDNFWLHYAKPEVLLQIHHFSESFEAMTKRLATQISSPILSESEQKFPPLKSIHFPNTTEMLTYFHDKLQKHDVDGCWDVLQDCKSQILPFLQSRFHWDEIQKWLQAIPTKQEIAQLLETNVIKLDILVWDLGVQVSNKVTEELSLMEFFFLANKEVPVFDTHAIALPRTKVLVEESKDTTTTEDSDMNTYLQRCRDDLEQVTKLAFEQIWKEILLQLSEQDWAALFSKYVTPWCRLVLNMFIARYSQSNTFDLSSIVVDILKTIS